MRRQTVRQFYFNPRAPCGARLENRRQRPDDAVISIHAPRAGRDLRQVAVRFGHGDFNPRAPCGARLANGKQQAITDTFQSTRPVRGATAGFRPEISSSRFQSTRPVRGATRRLRMLRQSVPISIHAPRAGRDSTTLKARSGRCHFNPRAPCGARQQKYTKLLYTLLRQKAILRQFHAKRRLLKRFSTYKYRNTFLICSANRMGKICTLPLRTTRSLDLPEGMSACSQSARFCFRTFFPSSKTADYPALDP